MASFRRIALIGKPNSREVDASLKDIRAFLAERGCQVQTEGKGADLAVVAGGRLGFMTDIGHDDMRAGLGAILDGRYVVEERALLDAEIQRNGKIMLRTVALNEAVVGKGAQGRLIEFELSLDGEFVYSLRADGILVATPTGSTAYALSAQGPILHPAVPALALVPLNPHTLSARPVSVSDKSVIEIRLARTSGLDAQCYFDGFALAELAPDDRLILKRSTHAARFVHPPGYKYFATLREKLGWSETLRKDRPT
jgi:NAD+ kinase